MRSICHGTPLGGLFHKIPFLIRSWVLRICPLFSTSPSAFDSAPKDRREQMPEEDLVELKFRLYDGSDIGPIRYSSSSTIAMLKERIISEWPRDAQLACACHLTSLHAIAASKPELETIEPYFYHDKKIVPKVANDVKLISAGKILENSKTIAQCRSPFGEPPADGITMHVVVQPSLTKAKTEKKVEELPKKTACSCSIL
ncbi:membrane-anchored ubiquitin-fold protein 4-like isoform X1 [Musa acuminata AAA Group]|uniref:membrane-anchored ubiquitin-fold protein 4-like isoform X1 n=1 Tax=Musa acuminata AAA Group TaxID=214697 RepID=UPI0031D033AE